MRVATDEELERQLDEEDRERHREQAFQFWATITALTVLLVVAYPPTEALGPTAGYLIVAALSVPVLAYIVKLRVVGPGSQLEVCAGAVLGSVCNGIDQWLAGGFSAPLFIIFPLTMLGSSAVLDEGPRRVVLASLVLITAAPLAYDSFTAPHAITVFVFAVILLIESTLLAEFSDRLRAQRLRLARAERQASMRALTDELTGLANRRALIARLDDEPLPAEVSAVYLDLNGFKAFNDGFGHAAGDCLLDRRAEALTAAVGASGQAFRVGGDEFCVLVDHAVSRDEPLVKRIVESLTEEGDGYSIAPSCGVAAMPHDSADVRDVLRMADERMYLEKRAEHPAPDARPDLQPAL